MGFGVEEVEGGEADKLPAAGGGGGIDAGLLFGDADGAGGDDGAGGVEAGGFDAGVHAAEVGEAGGESEHVYEVLGGGMDG